jgi:Fur family ferric uptake transcriptional regulator
LLRFQAKEQDYNVAGHAACFHAGGRYKYSAHQQKRYDATLNQTLRDTMPDTKDLRTMGLKATLPRLKVLELFQSAKVRHMSAEDVYKLLLNENADIGLATVYRVLTQFEQAGLLQRHHFEGGRAVFELNEGSHHDHLVCLQCGKVEEFYDAEIEKRQQKIARDRGFSLNEHSLYLYADCTRNNCPNKAQPS